VRIAQGYDIACNIAVENMKNISDTIEWSKDNIEPLVKSAMTSLGSKM
jgi:T-complex protein 1 subunit epsilon